MVMDDSKCLWCGQPKGFPFCCDGGKVRMGPVHIPKQFRTSVVKSYCYNDFLAGVLVSRTLRMELTDCEKWVLMMEDELNEWYNKLPSPSDDNSIVPKMEQVKPFTPLESFVESEVEKINGEIIEEEE
jgi:hypothetical protein